MEAVILVGIQGSGKSTFYRDYFFHTHMHINLDMLRTRHREQQFLRTCLETRQSFVVDNTNPTVAERAIYIQAAQVAQFRIVGYYFQSQITACQERNLRRPKARQIPLPGLCATAARLQRPSLVEGFDQLFYVRLEENHFLIEDWHDEIC